MSFYKDHYRIIDEIRKDRRMTVTELCDGIVSERTYYRSIKHLEKINFEVFTKLCQRLNLLPSQFVVYSTFYKKGSDSIYMFFYRVGVDYELEDDTSYEESKKHQSESHDFNRLVKGFIALYEWRRDRLSAEDFQRQISELVLEIGQIDDKNIYHLTLVTFLFLAGIELPFFSKTKLVEALIKVDYRFSFLVTLITMNFLLTHLVSKQEENVPLFNQLHQAYMGILKYTSINHFHMDNHLYNAYTHLRKKDQEKLDLSLYKYALSCSARYNQMRYQKYHQIVLDVFEVDLLEHIKENLVKKI